MFDIDEAFGLLWRLLKIMNELAEIMVCLVVTICQIISVLGHFRGMCCIHLQGDWIWFSWMLKWLRGRYIDYIGGLLGFWPVRAVERRSRDRYIKLVKILTICRPENDCFSHFSLWVPTGLVQGLCHCLWSKALITPDPCSLGVWSRQFLFQVTSASP